MLNRIFGAKTHTFLHVIGLSGLAFGLPFNKVVMSISMMFLVLNLLLESKFSAYWGRIKSNIGFLLILAFFVLHVVSLIWSIDLEYGLHDIKSKLPIFIIPLVLAAKPIENPKLLNIVLLSFLGSMTMTSFINFASFQQWFGPMSFDDIRGMSLFSSHVRYSLLVVMSIGIIIHLMLQKKGLLLILFPLFLWFNFYTYYSQILSGAITLAGVYSILIFYWAWNKQKAVAIIGLLTIITGFIFTIAIIFKPITYSISEYKNLDRKTSEGNFYYHSPTTISPETGKPIHIYICELELKREWQNASKIPFDGYDIKGQFIKNTLIRYMASMDIRKDAQGFSKLSSNDIKSIENGYASVHHHGLLSRIYGLQYQINNVSNPNGHSFLQRLEYWKTGSQIAAQHWLIGVGVGDVQKAFHHQYNRNNSILDYENRDRAHNMYLTTLLSLGIIGLALLAWSHVQFFILNFKKGQLVAIAFITIVLISYLVEDTLETQTGVTFFALFYGLFSMNLSKERRS